MNKKLSALIVLISTMFILVGCSDLEQFASEATDQAQQVLPTTKGSTSKSSSEASLESNSESESESASTSEVGEDSSIPVTSDSSKRSTVSKQGVTKSSPSKGTPAPSKSTDSNLQEAMRLINKKTDNAYDKTDFLIIPAQVNSNTLQLEIRRQSLSSNITNLVVIYRYNTKTKVLQEMDLVTGDFKEVD